MSQIMGNQTCLHVHLKFKLEIYKNHLWTAPKHFNEVHLANELRCAHNHHQTRIKFQTIHLSLVKNILI
jgi:hypothetical protein